MSTTWTIGAVAAAVGGELIGNDQVPVSGFTTDSRVVAAGDMFIGIQGERVDGGILAAEAAAAGAAGAIVSRSAFEAVGDAVGKLSLIVCDDPTLALGQLGRTARRGLACPVIGVTGSTGKTSTKDILGSILRSSGSAFTSAGNRNTEIGLPLEILQIPIDVDAVVLEMAMRGEGQIADLVAIAEPDAAIVVNVGPVHLETLGSIERVAAAKAELIAGLRPGSLCVVPAGDALLEPYLRSDLDTVTFGPTGECRLAGAEERLLSIEFRGAIHQVEVNFDQPHNRLNLLAAAGLALGLGFELPASLDVAFSGLRGQRRELSQGVVVIDDCYNANPMSMRAALADLSGESERRGGRRVAVLGDMLELGADSDHHHLQMGVDAVQAGVDLLITVGKRSEAAAGSFTGASVSVSDASEAADSLISLIEPGDVVLVKASRGVGLEVVGERLGREWS
jgi:UDP-N-acetylmuramoyl-tripeptide--D-alanyl-D-alanine ligase